MIQFNEYKLRLSTGETLEVSELVLSIQTITPEALREFEKIRHLCTELSHDEMEEAKIGYDRVLLKKLRSSSIGCLLKNPQPVCGLIRSCSMANPSLCTTKNVGKKIGKFPNCWTWPSEEPLSSELTDTIIHAWQVGKTVIIVT